MDADSLRIDLADMDDVRAQLPRARDILKRKQEALERSQKDYDSFRELVGLLARRAGVDLDDAAPDAPDSGSAESARASSDVLRPVVDVVNEHGGPIRARDVKAILIRRGFEVPGDAVRDALYYAAKRREPRLLQSLPERGYYAPLSYQRDDDQPALTTNGSDPVVDTVSVGFPVRHGGSGP
jgi:hypothetical protein